MFDINYTELFSALPPEVAVMLIAFIPIAEVRVSIPIALAVLVILKNRKPLLLNSKKQIFR